MRKKEEIVIKQSPYVEHSKEHAMKLSVVEGSILASGRNISGSYMTPFALAIGANSFQIGLMSSLFGLVAPIGQIRGSKLMEKYSRKSILRNSKLIHALLWILIVGLAYLSWKGIASIYLPYALILVWAVFIQYIWGIGYVTWFSWMGDLVPAKIRGKYFAHRNRISNFAGLVSFILAAFVLDYFKTAGLLLFGFSLLFGIAFVLRFISRALIGKQFNPQFRVKKGYYFSFREFLKGHDNYSKFAWFQAFFFFSVMVSSPFFAVHMLNDLGFNYITFTIVAISSTFFYLIFTPLAGKFSDKYGNLKLLYVAGFLFPFVPLMWMFIESPIWLIFVPGLISGAANSAYILGTTNFTYEITKPQKRGLYVAYTAVLIGFGMFFGGLLGGAIIQYVPITFMSPIRFTFGLSTLLMIMTSLFFLTQIKELSKYARMKGFRSDWHHPFKSIGSDIIWFKNFIHE